MKRRYFSNEVHGVINKTAVLVLLFNLRSLQAKAILVRIVFRQALEVCHPRCVCENWKGYVVKHMICTPHPILCV